MHRVRRSKCFTGTNTAIDAATHACAWRSDKATRNGTDSRHGHADESNRAAGHTANKSDRTAGKYRHTSSNAISNTACG